MVTFLWVVFGGAFFIAVTRAWYRFGFRKGQEAYVKIYLESVKEMQDRRAEKKMFIEGTRNLNETLREHKKENAHGKNG